MRATMILCEAVLADLVRSFQKISGHTRPRSRAALLWPEFSKPLWSDREPRVKQQERSEHRRSRLELSSRQALHRAAPEKKERRMGMLVFILMDNHVAHLKFPQFHSRHHRPHQKRCHIGNWHGHSCSLREDPLDRNWAAMRPLQL